MKKLSLTVFAVLITAGLSTAQADGFMPWTDIMKMADENNDSMVSPNEVMTFKFAAQYPGFQPFIATHFMKFDANSDGMISADEFHSEMGTMRMTDDDMNAAFTKGAGFMPWDK